MLLARRAAAEVIGTAFLLAAVVGSGIAAQRLTDIAALQLLANSIATGAVLVALILMFQHVGASFNPVISLVERMLGRHDTRTTVVAILAQCAGAVVGVVLANLMFGLSWVSISQNERSGASIWLAEIIATLGLVLVVFGILRRGNVEYVAFAVAGYITAAYWFTSSTSFANPAVTIARMFSDTFAGISPSSVPAFLVAQVVAAAVAVPLVAWLFVSRSQEATP